MIKCSTLSSCQYFNSTNRNIEFNNALHVQISEESKKIQLNNKIQLLILREKSEGYNYNAQLSQAVVSPLLIKEGDN